MVRLQVYLIRHLTNPYLLACLAHQLGWMDQYLEKGLGLELAYLDRHL